MGFDGAATLSGVETGVQARLKKRAPHAVSVYCHHLQLACVQAANSTTGIKHVYTMLTSPWKYFHFSSKRAESLKEIQHLSTGLHFTISGQAQQKSSNKTA